MIAKFCENLSYVVRAAFGFLGDTVALPTAASAAIPALNGDYFGLTPEALAGGVVLSAVTSLSTYRVDLALRNRSRFAGRAEVARGGENNTWSNRLTCLGHFLDTVGELMTIGALIISLEYKSSDPAVVDETEVLYYGIALFTAALASLTALATARDALGMTGFFASFVQAGAEAAPTEGDPLINDGLTP